MLFKSNFPHTAVLGAKHSLKMLANLNAMVATSHFINPVMFRPTIAPIILTSLKSMMATIDSLTKTRDRVIASSRSNNLAIPRLAIATISPASLKAITANVESLIRTHDRLTDSLLKQASLQTTLLPMDFSIPEVPSLDLPDANSENRTHDEPDKRPRRIGFNREDKNSEEV